MLQCFTDISSSAKVWIFQAERRLTSFEIDFLSRELQNFISSWSAHGATLSAKFELFFQQVFVVAVDESQVKPSGCSLDKLMQFFQMLSEKAGLNLMDRNIALVSENSLKLVSLNIFKENLRKGIYNSKTKILNNTVDTVELLQTNWIVPVEKSWASRLVSVGTN
jgi:hypothetical protein